MGDTEKAPPPADEPAPTVRSVLLATAAQNLAEARRAAQEVVDELAKDGGGEDDVIDGHLLDLRWALGEKRGTGNALYDLTEAGLLGEPDPSGYDNEQDGEG